MSNEELGVSADITVKPEPAEESTGQAETTEEQIQHEIQERLKATGICAAGYAWHKEDGGYRCAGGAHFMSKAELGITI